MGILCEKYVILRGINLLGDVVTLNGVCGTDVVDF